MKKLTAISVIALLLISIVPLAIAEEDSNDIDKVEDDSKTAERALRENKKAEETASEATEQSVPVVEVAVINPIIEKVPQREVVQTLPIAPKKRLPEGVIKVDIVILNSKRYKKTFRIDGTTQMELLD